MFFGQRLKLSPFFELPKSNMRLEMSSDTRFLRGEEMMVVELGVNGRDPNHHELSGNVHVCKGTRARDMAIESRFSVIAFHA
jgi:hypothetical protein